MGGGGIISPPHSFFHQWGVWRLFAAFLLCVSPSRSRIDETHTLSHARWLSRSLTSRHKTHRHSTWTVCEIAPLIHSCVFLAVSHVHTFIIAKSVAQGGHCQTAYYHTACHTLFQTETKLNAVRERKRKTNDDTEGKQKRA